MLNQQDLGARIALLRHRRHLTQQQLADLCRISPQAVSKWERGRSCPDILILDELAAALCVEIQELFAPDANN